MRRIFWTALVVPLVSILIAIGTATAMPATRHLASAWWNAPVGLPALAANGQIHYEPGAEGYAREIAVLPPAAIARVEAAHGRPFVRPVTIGAYATPETYAAANPSGNPGAVGSTAFGDLVLSPTLSGPQHDRLPAILTHELSHAHLQGYLNAYAFTRLPNWFKEGLAVMVSNGGGAEFVSVNEARRAIQRGEHIDIEDRGSFLNMTDIRFDHAPAGIRPSQRTVMAYRQAGMFVSFLHDSNTAGFDRLMNAVLDGHTFADSVAIGYRSDIASLWQKFAAGQAA